MVRKALLTLLLIILVTLVLFFLFPKSRVSFPEGGWLLSSKGRICECFGYSTPLVTYHDMGKEVSEQVFQKSQCFGVIYNCKEFSSFSDIK